LRTNKLSFVRDFAGLGSEEASFQLFPIEVDCFHVVEAKEK
jgi:hypothetical protein